MKYIFTSTLILICSYAFSQMLNPFYFQVSAQANQDSIMKNLRTFESFGVKSCGSQNLKNTGNWIKENYAAMGYNNIATDEFLYNSDTLFNLIITKTGTINPNKILLICSHYDTDSGPGSNDNGSGTVIITEIARLLKNIETTFTIKFVHFTGEEEGFLGSTNYVSNTMQNEDIFLVFNIDEVGGVNTGNTTIICEKDINMPLGNNAASASFTDSLANIMELYTTLQTEINFAYGSDYIPFQQAGKVITGLFEKNESPYVHSANDVISNLDTNYIYEICKGSVAACMHFAKALEPNYSLKNEYHNTVICIHPNPASDTFNLTITPEIRNKEICIFDIHGKIIKTLNVGSGGNFSFSLNDKGTYLYRIFTGPQKYYSGIITKQ